ncbi:transcription initiation factor TFIID subunit 11-like [Raphanus sativus]|uniref:Transcription initiation factor TFIID subunit 11-like n=1 Tax=Raphanus sativus TaxID=3726 RepID=A0A6J0M5Q8_RAPSA|nr:transcription initiation factor TFIID subunit 11-like [Raphanus sativus]
MNHECKVTWVMAEYMLAKKKEQVSVYSLLILYGKHILSHIYVFSERISVLSRYECFRRSTLHKSNMKKLLESITGTKNMNNDDPRLSVVSGIAKMFVGELVETARLIMVKRKESGHIRQTLPYPRVLS